MKLLVHVNRNGNHGSHKDWKNEKTFSSRGILNRLEKSGNFTQNTGKMREFYPKYWKSEDILASFYIYFFSLTFYLKCLCKIDFCIF